MPCGLIHHTSVVYVVLKHPYYTHLPLHRLHHPEAVDRLHLALSSLCAPVMSDSWLKQVAFIHVRRQPQGGGRRVVPPADRPVVRIRDMRGVEDVFQHCWGVVGVG